MVTDAKQQKIEAAREALRYVENGMRLGLGTGSTSAEFVKLLGEAMARKSINDIRAVCTSVATQKLADSLSIPLSTLKDLKELDLAIDGADEIDANLRLIKGGGGALLREKVVEQAARRFIVIADESKVTPKLGGVRLPVEVVKFAAELLMLRFADMQLDPILRQRDGDPFQTDEHHFIIDVVVPQSREIADVVAGVRRYAGVVETGFFPDEATDAIIATNNGIRMMTR